MYDTSKYINILIVDFVRTDYLRTYGTIYINQNFIITTATKLPKNGETIDSKNVVTAQRRAR